MRTIYAAAVIAAAFAAPAFAQDATPAAFNGGHVEILAGIDSIGAGGSSEEGVAYGIAGGYDFRSGNAVFGVEAEAADSTTDQGLTEATRDLYIGARAGALVGSNMLLYGKLGYANAGASFAGADANFDGIRAGAGLEYLVGRNVSLRAEYRYTNYEQGLSRNQGVVGLGFRF